MDKTLGAILATPIADQLKELRTDRIVVTDNISEKIEAIDDGERFTILCRKKGNCSDTKADNIILLNPLEAKKIANFLRERLFQKFM